MNKTFLFLRPFNFQILLYRQRRRKNAKERENKKVRKKNLNTFDRSNLYPVTIRYRPTGAYSKGDVYDSNTRLQKLIQVIEIMPTPTNFRRWNKKQLCKWNQKQYLNEVIVINIYVEIYSKYVRGV